MVHALREAERVLKPGGLIIDLRPAIQHRRVSVGGPNPPGPPSPTPLRYEGLRPLRSAARNFDLKGRGEKTGDSPGSLDAVTPPRLVGVLREVFDDDHAANRAVALMTGRAGQRGEGGATARGRGAVGRGVGTAPLQFVRRTQIDCDRVMDGLDDLREWVADFMSRGAKLPPHDWLVERAGRALARQPGRAKVVIAGPLDLRLLRKR